MFMETKESQLLLSRIQMEVFEQLFLDQTASATLMERAGALHRSLHRSALSSSFAPSACSPMPFLPPLGPFFSFGLIFVISLFSSNVLVFHADQPAWFVALIIVAVIGCLHMYCIGIHHVNTFTYAYVEIYRYTLVHVYVYKINLYSR